MKSSNEFSVFWMKLCSLKACSSRDAAMKFGGCENGDSERPGDSDAKRLGVDDIEGFVGANLRRVSEEPEPAE